MADEKRRSVASVALVTSLLIVLLSIKTASQWDAMMWLDRVIVICMWIGALIGAAAIMATIWRYWRLRLASGR